MWQKWRKKWRELVISQYRGSAPGLFAPVRTTCCLLDPCGWEIRITSNTARVIDWVKHLIPIARRPPWLSPPLGSLRGHSRVTLLAWWSTQFVNFGALQGNDIGRIGVPDLPFATTFTLVCYDWLRTGDSHWLRTGGCNWLTCQPGPTDCFTATTLHSHQNPKYYLHTSGNCIR